MDDQPIESTNEEHAGGPGARVFMEIAGLVLVVGLSIGGAFGIGVQVGQSQAEDVEEVPPLAITAEDSFIEMEEDDEDADAESVTLGPRGGGVLSGDGEIPPEVIQQLRAQGATDADIAAMRAQVREFQRGEGAGIPQGRPGFLAGAGAADADIGARMTGTIESIDGDTIVLTTPAGPQRVSTIAGTRITVTRTGGIDDLAVGDQVAVATVPGPDTDTLEAASITVVPVDE